MASFKFINTFSLLFSLFSTITDMGASPQYVNGCSTSEQGPIISTTPLVTFLEQVQETALNTFGPKGFDPKLYVDLSLKFDLATTKQAFDSLSRTQNGSVLGSEFNGFLKGYLEGADEDLVYVEPVDFVDEPVGFLPKVENQEMRDWALEVHSLWKNLSRKVSDQVLEKPDLHTLLPMKNPVIIPGSRFREVYYWDSYWVIRGLLTSKMYETAKGIVTNLIALIDEYGHVLNGARAYYTNRSQPPLLSSMVFDIYNRTGDMDLVQKSLPALLKEHTFWNTGKHMVTMVDAQGSTHNLSRYYAMWNEPRPESSTITTEKAECIEVLYSTTIRTEVGGDVQHSDKETAQNISDVCEKQHLYRELASTAESGWDFSTRWMRNGSDLTTLATTSILPVDLNAFILKMELDIAFLATVAGDSNTALQFREASQARQKAMNSVFWDAEKGQWFDYWLDDSAMNKDVYKLDSSYRSQDIFASNFMPLWIQLFNADGSVVEKVTQSLQSSGLVCAVGIATSLKASGQQWDFPNGWAPIQHTIVEGLVRSESEEARSLAKDIAISWIRTNYVAFKASGAMHEKYDVQKCGEFGGGGEYKPQTGFGWSNGVVLAFLEEFGWPQDLKLDC